MHGLPWARCLTGMTDFPCFTICFTAGPTGGWIILGVRDTRHLADHSALLHDTLTIDDDDEAAIRAVLARVCLCITYIYTCMYALTIDDDDDAAVRAVLALGQACMFVYMYIIYQSIYLSTYMYVYMYMYVLHTHTHTHTHAHTHTHTNTN